VRASRAADEHIHQQQLLLVLLLLPLVPLPPWLPT